MIINILHADRDRSTIEWTEDGVLKRGIIPNNLLDGNVVDDAAMSLVVPYGVDWAFLLSEGAYRPATPEEIANQLHRNGIWTLDDARANPQAVQGSILSAYGVTFNTLLRLAEDFQTRR